MNIPAVTTFNPRLKIPNYTSNTIYNEKNVIEQDITSLYDTKEIFNNTLYPNSKILGIKLQRKNDKNINLISRYGHTVGQINYNPNVEQPKMNVKLGAHQPIIEITDEDLGITVLMTRGSNLNGKDLNINYKSLSNNISFGHKLVVTTGYKPEKTEQVVEDYSKYQKYNDLLVDNTSLYKLKNDYTIVGLCGGFGTRLSPISELEGNNKPSTKYPGINKSLMELSVLDKAYQLKNIDEIDFLRDSDKNLVGTAGIIIKGLKDGTISMEKPLVILTGDTFNNVNLVKALRNFESDSECGMAMVVNKVDNVYDKSCVLFNHSPNAQTFEIEDFSALVNDENREEIKNKFGVYNFGNYKNEYFSSTNILILKPEILKILKNYANYDGSADLTEFVGLMFNVMNKPYENLSYKYPNGLSSKNLTLRDLSFSDGTPHSIYNKNNDALKLKAIVAEDINSNNAICEDVGTVENFIQTVQTIKNKEIPGIDKKVLSGIKNNVSDENILFFGDNPQERLEEFKSKYNIKNLSGNVIVYAKPLQNKPANVNKVSEKLYNLAKNDIAAKQFIEKVCSNKTEAQKTAISLIKENGLSNFMNWYMNSKGYYGAFEKYTEDLYKNAQSIDELIKFMPNWAPWKLEQKSWMLKHPEVKYLSEAEQKTLFNKTNDKQREEEFEIGDLPTGFYSSYCFKNMVTKLKTFVPDSDYTGDYTTGYMTIKKLKGGELNDKFVYKLDFGDKKYILKFDRTNIEDSYNIDNRRLSDYEKKIIRKNKYLAPDSIYTGACISKYLELNGCENVPKLYYYNNCANAALYEYVEDVNNDEFQIGVLGDDCEEILTANKEFSSLNNLGIYLNDTAYKNILTDKNGVRKVIDLGHSNFMLPFKPGIKHYNIAFPNSNGPDLSNIYGSLFAMLQL